MISIQNDRDKTNMSHWYSYIISNLILVTKILWLKFIPGLPITVQNDSIASIPIRAENQRKRKKVRSFIPSLERQ